MPEELPPSPARRALRAIVPWLPAIAAVAWALWMRWIFWPGNLSWDSFDQIAQAHRGRYDDHHPPIVPIVLRLVFRLDVPSLITAQWLAGLAGLFAFVHTAASQLVPRMSQRARRLVANGVVLVLVSPATPLCFYLVTLWKDTWLLIALLWLVPALLRLQRLPPHDRRRPFALGAVAVSATLAALVRHNALVLLGVVALILGAQHWGAGRRRAAALAALPIVAWLAADLALDACFTIDHRYMFNVTMVHDTLGLCVYRSESCADVPYTLERYGFDDLEQSFVYGDVQRMLEGPLHKRFSIERPDPELRREWLAAVLAHPLDYLAVKALAYAQILNLRGGPSYYFLPLIRQAGGRGGARWGLAHDPARQAARDFASRASLAVVDAPLLNPLLGSHAPWLVAALLGTLAGLVSSRRGGDVAPALVPFAVALTYSLSYLLAAGTRDWRYMFPATFVTQATLLLLVSKAIARRMLKLEVS